MQDWYIYNYIIRPIWPFRWYTRNSTVKYIWYDVKSINNKKNM